MKSHRFDGGPVTHHLLLRTARHFRLVSGHWGIFVFADMQLLGGSWDLATTCNWACKTLLTIGVISIRPVTETISPVISQL